MDASAWMTLPSASSEPLMLAASLSPLPVTPDFFTRSEPARSTTLSLPSVAWNFCAPPACCAPPAVRGLRITFSCMTACERLEALFILVSAYTMLLRPRAKSLSSASGEAHLCHERPATSPPLCTARLSPLPCRWPSPSRSSTCSL